MHTKAFPYIGLLSLFWGTNIVASRFGIGEFDPYLFIALRLSIATLFFWPIFFMSGQPWPTDLNLWRHAAVSGVVGVAIPMTFFILSLQYQSSGMASILVTASPALMVIAAHLFLPDERMTRNKALGVALALLGSLLLVWRGESGLVGVGRASPLAFLLILVGQLFDIATAIHIRRRMLDMHPMAVTAIRLSVGALVMLALSLAVTDFSRLAITTAGYFSLGYAALIGALGGQFLAFHVTRRFGATAFSLTSYLVPVVATTFGVFVLGEIVTWVMLVGVALIGGGIQLINRQAYPGKRTVRPLP
jgi:drug/metabolite transporter (DMT)-like permease